MKKYYIHPTIKVLDLNEKQTILQGSADIDGPGPIEGGDNDPRFDEEDIKV